MKEEISVGLDIGHHHVNMVKLLREGEALTLLDYASVTVDSARGREGILQTLQSLVKEKGLSAQPINAGMSGESVIVRYVDMPKMDKKELNQALKYEAQQYIPFKMEEVTFDYHLLKPLSDATNKVRVLLVAAKREAVVDFVKLIQQAGLSIKLIDVNSFALINCFGVNGAQEETSALALVNLGSELVNVNIIQAQTPYFTRDISLSEDISSLYHHQDNRIEQAIEEMKPLLRNLTRELRLSIDYFESEFEHLVDKMYLSGEGAKSSSLLRFFSETLGREVLSWNPLSSLNMDASHVDVNELKKDAPVLALACGLALRR